MDEDNQEFLTFSFSATPWLDWNRNSLLISLLRGAIVIELQLLRNCHSDCLLSSCDLFPLDIFKYLLLVNFSRKTFIVPWKLVITTTDINFLYLFVLIFIKYFHATNYTWRNSTSTFYDTTLLLFATQRFLVFRYNKLEEIIL